MEDAHEIVVSVPARPEHLHILRTVAAAVAVRADFTVDAIEDLKIAVDETVSQLLRGGPASNITLRVRVSRDAVEVNAHSDTLPAGPWPPEGYERSLAWKVLTALTDETAFAEDGGAVVRFAKRRA